MKLLLSNRNLILAIDPVIEFGVFDEPTEKWKVGNSYALDNGYSATEVDTVPIEVIPHKYFFIDGVFVKNPNYIDAGETENKIQSLETELQTTQQFVLETEYRLCVMELGLI